MASGSSSKAGIRLRGRFPAGTEVRLVKVAGPHVMRPGVADETVDTQTVDEDGGLEFSKGVEEGERYFAVANVDGFPREVRLTGKADPEESLLSGYEPVLPERAKLGIGGIGGWSDEPQPRDEGEKVPEGATWVAQDQVSEGTLQRSDTLRGSAAIVSEDERERATRQWRKQEPTNPVVETPEAGEESARTAEPPDVSPAQGSGGGSAKATREPREKDAGAKPSTSAAKDSEPRDSRDRAKARAKE